jgi:hypothetical protein
MSCAAGVVELWAFLGRFADLLGLDRVPSVTELEADLAAPSGPRSITTSALVRGPLSFAKSRGSFLGREGRTKLIRCVVLRLVAQATASGAMYL